MQKSEKIKPQEKQIIKKAFINSLINFISITPMILAVIVLVSVFQIYITPDILSTLFGAGIFSDTLVGTFLGGISSGNGAISYVIADGLKEQGVSAYALSAFILAWVTLGFVHLPAEASVFGVRFTVYRNIFALISTIVIAYLTVITTGLFV